MVAIVAILAAIGVPNFLEAQTRAKASRVKADLRSVAIGIEAYATDNNGYPNNDGVYNILPVTITTPVAYLTSSLLVDPFSDKERVALPAVNPELARYYTYTRIVTFQEVSPLVMAGIPPPVEGVDSPGFNPGAFQRYGRWRLVSNGPDTKYSRPSVDPAGPFNPNPGSLRGADIPYDPTNSTISWGNILRTQIQTDGAAVRD